MENPEDTVSECSASTSVSGPQRSTNARPLADHERRLTNIENQLEVMTEQLAHIPVMIQQVCERQFRESDIGTSSYVDSKTGKVVEANLQTARLSPHAIPSVFLKFPAYISAPARATSAEAPDEKQMRLETASLREAIAAAPHTDEVEESRNKIDYFQALLGRVSEIQFSSF
ncbi:hypothetical protein HPB51_018430 [Rhipicephalus microplus]|uniref:Uncharacterized protein n=1 Tax=Rhipicephalus microplus TaxID=6941 RepID=A0A9J6EHN3_RHIMP|nr:hypothetical protein HPB51_018430 [Rhipicephalus microplus]